MTETQRKIAKDLLKIKAVFFRPNEPFTWASGIKSPVYCDNRLTLTDVEVRNDVEQGLAQIIRENYPDAEVLMGTSTAGIAHAAITRSHYESSDGICALGCKRPRQTKPNRRQARKGSKGRRCRGLNLNGRQRYRGCRCPARGRRGGTRNRKHLYLRNEKRA